MTITKEGSLASFYTMNKAPLKHLKVYFSPKQAGSGDPSPSNIREISGTNFVRMYNAANIKKIMPLSHADVQTGNSTIHSLGDGKYEIQNTNQNAIIRWDYDIGPITIEDDGYWFFLNSSITSSLETYDLAISLRDQNDSNIVSIFFNNYSTNDNNFYVYLPKNEVQQLIGRTITHGRFLVQSTIAEKNFTVCPIMIKASDLTMTDLNFSTNNIDTIYGGYVDLITGELIETWGSVDLGSINTWYVQTYENTKWFRATLPTEVWQNTWRPNVTSSLNNHPPHFLIDRFKIVSGASIYYGTSGDNVLGMDWLATIRIKCDSYNDDIDAFKAAINGKILYYEYATPITHQLTPTQLQTFIGKNNIWSNADRVEVEYDLAETNEELYKRRNIILNGAPHLVNSSDNMISINTNIIAPLKECKINFSPVQNGSNTPDPSNIRPITGINQLSLTRAKANLIDLSTATFTNNSTYVDTTINNNTITVTAKQHMKGFQSQATLVWPIPPAFIGKQIYMGCTGITHNNENHNCTVVCQYEDINNNRISDPTVISLTSYSRKYTIPEGAVVAKIFFRIAQNVGTYNAEIGDYVTYTNFYISETNEYENYNGTTIPINWESDYGTIYGGYLDLINGKLVQTYKSVILNGSESGWSTYGALERNDFCAVFYFSDKKKGYQTSKCNKLVNIDSAFAAYNYAYGAYSDHSSLTNIYFCMPNANVTTLAAFKNWLSENPIQYVYELATPIEHTLTPQTLKTLKGTNNIWSNANGPVSIKYWTH